MFFDNSGFKFHSTSSGDGRPSFLVHPSNKFGCDHNLYKYRIWHLVHSSTWDKCCYKYLISNISYEILHTLLLRYPHKKKKMYWLGWWIFLSSSLFKIVKLIGLVYWLGWFPPSPLQHSKSSSIILFNYWFGHSIE